MGGAEFERYFGLSRDAFDALPPFKQTKYKDNARKAVAAEQAAQQAKAAKAEEAAAEEARQAELQKQKASEGELQAICNLVGAEGPNGLLKVNARRLKENGAMLAEGLKELKGITATEYTPCYYVLWPELPQSWRAPVPKGERYLVRYQSDRSQKANAVYTLTSSPSPSNVAVAARKTSTTGEANSFRVTITEAVGGKGGGKSKTKVIELAAPSGRKKWIAAIAGNGASTAEEEGGAAAAADGGGAGRTRSNTAVAEEEEVVVKAELVKEEATVDELEALEGTAFEEIFGMPKEKYEALPPFRKPKIKAAAQAKHKEMAGAKNAVALAAAAAEQAKLDEAAAKEAEKRIVVGDYIAKNGNSCLLSASPSFLKAYSVHAGPLKQEGFGSSSGGSGGGFTKGATSQYCMLFPSVVFPSIPPAEKFFFIFESEQSKRPSTVLHLIPGEYEVAKPGKARQGQKHCFRVDALRLAKDTGGGGGGSGSGSGLFGSSKQDKPKIVLAAPSFEAQRQWMDFLQGQGAVAAQAAAPRGSMKAMAASGSLSEYDFYVTLKQGKKKVRLSVTKEALLIYEGGRKIDDVPIASIKQWKPKPKEMEFLLLNGKKWVLLTVEGALIKEAIRKQALAIKAERDAKAKAAEEARQKAEAERQAKAAEAAKWLSYEQLQSGDYSGCSRLPVDEKNKEDWLNDEVFSKVFGKSREEWAKVPPFKKPIIKKKLGLQPL
jgi:hypothetical protein